MPDQPTPPEPGLREIAQVVPDTRALKALAHPERLRLLALLRVDGPATASGLARRLGLNSGATSYHLRQLAKHGFIAPAEGLGTARERFWQARHESTRYETSASSGAELEAGMALTEAVLQQQMALLRAAQDGYRDLPAPWREASTASDFIIPLTADAAQDLLDEVTALIWRAKAAAPPAAAPHPEGTRNYMIMLHGFPFPELGPGPEGEGEA